MSGASLPLVDVVIVSWNHAASLRGCLTALEAASRHEYLIDRVVVVDNASRQPFRPDGYPRLPPIEMMVNRRNLGFAAACNQGARHSRASYLLFLNPDTRVGPASVETGVRILHGDADQQIGLVGIQLVDEQGKTQATCGRFPTASNVFNQISGLSLVAPERFGGIRMTDWNHRDTRLVDFASAASLLVRRQVFECLGGFDDRLTVYLEDADLALRARARGWKTGFAADAPIIHADGWASGRNRAWRMAHSWRSLVQYGWKHFGVGDALAVTLVILTIAPVARLAQATLHRSARQVLAAGAGYACLWGLLGRDLLTKRSNGQSSWPKPGSE